VSRLRTKENISLHNLLINKYLIEEQYDELNRVSIETYDLILDTHEDLMIVNELRVGSKYSMWREAFRLIRKYKPSYLILTGNLLSFDDSYIYDEYKDMVEILTEIEEDTKIFYVPQYISKGQWIKRVLYELYLKDTDIADRKMEIRDKENILERLTRLVLTAKKSMVIMKLTWSNKITLEIVLHGSQDKSFEKAVADLKMLNKEYEWLVTNYINKPYIDDKTKIVTLGEWHMEWDKYEAPEPGILYLTMDGELKIIKPDGD